MQKEFSWAGVAAAGVGAGVGHVVGSASGATSLYNNPTAGNFAANVVKSGAQVIADAATRSLIEGTDFGDNVIAALPTALGSLVGEALMGQMHGRAAPSAKVGATPRNVKDVAALCQVAYQSDEQNTDVYAVPDSLADLIPDDWRQGIGKLKDYNIYLGDAVEADEIVVTARRNSGGGDYVGRVVTEADIAAARAGLEAMRQTQRVEQAALSAAEWQAGLVAARAASDSVMRGVGNVYWQTARDWAPVVSDISGAVDFANRPTWLGGAAVAVGIVPFVGDGAARLLRHADEADEALSHLDNVPVMHDPLSGPQPPRSALGGHRTYPDPAPRQYDIDMTPDTPVVDHNWARGLGGSSTDLENLSPRTWAENSRKAVLRVNIS